MVRFLPRIYRPEVYQGRRNPGKYFEGWYVKLVDDRGENIWSLIPGISYSDDSHSFVQLIHANSGKTRYMRFSLAEFKSSTRVFKTNIGSNLFSSAGMSVDLEEPDFQLKGELEFSDVRSFPGSLISPGIMGWYSYAPRMECYHGVVSMQHNLSGSLLIDGSEINFDGGKGYIEKDWGRSMPSDWIWIQSNHFENDPEASFMLSLARIPWMGGFFPGFLSFFSTGGQLYRFATYRRSVVDLVEVNNDEVHIKLSDAKHCLDIKVYRKLAGVLKAPRHGNMDREIQESIVSRMHLELKNKEGKVLFEGRGDHAGLEIVGDVAKYFQNNR